MLFSEKLNSFFRQAGLQASIHVPELRGFVVIYDYFGTLNDLNGLSKGIALSSDGGPINTPDGLVGITLATMQGLAHLQDDLMNTALGISDHIKESQKELLAAKEELASLQEKIAAAKGETK
jgi:hypothetical protein